MATRQRPPLLLESARTEAGECLPCRTAATYGWWDGTVPANYVHCGRCHIDFRGNDTIGHCMGCHETFSGDRAFTLHRQSTVPGQLCLTRSEIEALRHTTGYWAGTPVLELERGVWRQAVGFGAS